MWSLYSKTDNEDSVNPFDTNGVKLPPMEFSNGKTQEDIVKEILDLIGKGEKLIFIKGVCGSGKSAIALNLARHFKKTSIVVPIKSLQEQYERDYTKKKFILKKDKSPLRISVIKGRNNFPCRFGGDRADDSDIPCTIEIREKNTEQLLKYIKENPATNPEDFSSAKDIGRINVAAACPYWAPIMPSDINPKGLGSFEKKKYMSVSGKEYAVFQRKIGCPYYDQYKAYYDSDVLIYNSMKYQLETIIGRKPKTELDIIDECDEFLDNFANEKRLNLNRLQNALITLMPQTQEKRNALKGIINIVNEMVFSPPVTELQKLLDSPVMDLMEKILENPNLAEDEETNYYNNAVETARTFENLLKETYISVEKISNKDSNQNGLFNSRSISKEDSVFINLVSINLAQKLEELIEANDILVMMSGTLHSEKVLRDIFGLDKFKIVEAETKNPGKVYNQKTGLERNCSFSNFKNETITRNQYLKILDMCMAKSIPPTLVHVSAFRDLPSEEENKKLMLDNLITQEKLRMLQSRGNESINEFHSRETDVLFTTKASRGVDFPGDKCNSIVVTKFPYPNIQGLFWKILKKEQPEKFMEFYLDKARRELVQRVSRGVRYQGDYVKLFSPDSRVINTSFD